MVSLPVDFHGVKGEEIWLNKINYDGKTKVLRALKIFEDFLFRLKFIPVAFPGIKASTRTASRSKSWVGLCCFSFGFSPFILTKSGKFLIFGIKIVPVLLNKSSSKSDIKNDAEKSF